MAHAPACKTSQTGPLLYSRACATTHPPWGNSGMKRSAGQSSRPLESPHHRPSAFGQSDTVWECYANKPSCPASQEPRPLSPSSPRQRPLSPQSAVLAAASLATGRRLSRHTATPNTRLKKKWFPEVTWERMRAGPGPGQRWAASLVAPGTFPVVIWNWLEMLSNLPGLHFAWEQSLALSKHLLSIC